MEENDAEERRSRIPAARAQLIKRRWERSKERMRREGIVKFMKIADRPRPREHT